MKRSAPKNFVIVGGGTAGWMAAATLARVLYGGGQRPGSVTLVESAEIGTVGVGEATIPAILDYLRFLNIDEADFMARTDATHKLAIRFRDWKAIGEDYWHPFGTLGPTVENRPLFQHWLRDRQQGEPIVSLMNLSIAAQLSEAGKFARPSNDPKSSLGGLSYALHFDAGLVAAYLRRYAETRHVRRLEGRITSVATNDHGEIASLHLADGRIVQGDFFVDCSGFSALLIGKTLGSTFDDWSHWLPCNRAIAAPTISAAATHPFTVSTARTAGWTWRIPLQSRVGNGYVYAADFEAPSAAEHLFLEAVGTDRQAEPRHLTFTAGRRRGQWMGKCLSLGLASGFLEPLESTSIHLVFANLYRFLDVFPDGENDPALRRAFNARAAQEIEEIRDFLILHYCTTERRDTEFWRYVAHVALPDSLQERLDLYRNAGRIPTDFYQLFKPFSWISVLEGMGVAAKGYDPLIDAVAPDASRKILRSIADNIAGEVHKAAIYGVRTPAKELSIQ